MRSARQQAIRIAALLLAGLVILFLRQPDQFLRPYVWIEEGTFTLPGYIERGWLELFQPVSGYLLIISKVMGVAAFQLSALHAPALLAAFAVAGALLVAGAVALSPTYLRQPVLCAFALLLVPSDPEVFAVAADAFWWAGVLLPLALLWREEQQWLRALCLIVGGFSSPLIVPTAALLTLRFAFERTRREAVAAALAALIAIVQISVMLREGTAGNLIVPKPQILAALAQKFVGGFFQVDAALPGLLIAAAIALAAWFLRARLDRYFVLLVLMFAAAALTVSLRQPMFVIDRFTAGPRYFFYPFVLLGWLIVWLGAVAPKPMQIALATAVFASLVIAGPRLSRRHDGVDWRSHLLTCARADSYDLPIHWDGSASHLWHVRLTGAQCRALLARSLF